MTDSVRVTANGRPAKPLTSEIFDVLAQEAAAGGHRHFAFINADIVVTQRPLPQ